MTRELVADGGAVVARVGGALALACFWIDADRVDEADVAAALCRESSRLQRFLHRFGEVLLHQNHVGHPLVVKSRSVDRRLRFHAETHPVKNAEQR